MHVTYLPERSIMRMVKELDKNILFASPFLALQWFQ